MTHSLMFLLVACALTLGSVAASVDHLSMLQLGALQQAQGAGQEIDEEAVVRAFAPTECGGKTTAGSTTWTQLRDNQICVVIDTSSCGFEATPVYFPNINGDEKHDQSMGAAMVVKPSPKEFKVCVGYPKITPADANKWKWHINWLGYGSTPKGHPLDTKMCYGRSVDRHDLDAPGNKKVWETMAPKIKGKWMADPDDKNAFYFDMNTDFCGFSETPIYIVRVAGYWKSEPLVGAEAVINPSKTGFRVRLHKYYTFQEFTMPLEKLNKGWGTIHFVAMGKGPKLPPTQPEHHTPIKSGSKADPFGPLDMDRIPAKQMIYSAGWSKPLSAPGWQPMPKSCKYGDPKATIPAPAQLLSLACDEPMWWNTTNMGQMHDVHCDYISHLWEDPLNHYQPSNLKKYAKRTVRQSASVQKHNAAFKIKMRECNFNVIRHELALSFA